MFGFLVWVCLFSGLCGFGFWFVGAMLVVLYFGFGVCQFPGLLVELDFWGVLCSLVLLWLIWVRWVVELFGACFCGWFAFEFGFC